MHRDQQHRARRPGRPPTIFEWGGSRGAFERLPADPEFRAAIIGYAEWGSRLALRNSQPGAAVAERAPVPRWGWGVAPPYQP